MLCTTWGRPPLSPPYKTTAACEVAMKSVEWTALIDLGILIIVAGMAAIPFGYLQTPWHALVIAVGLVLFACGDSLRRKSA